jgi:hypothetical protein
MEKDYLKYWRVIRYFIKSKYGLTQEDLDMEFDELMSWNKNRFEQLRHDGWIEVFRKRLRDRKALYQLSYKAQRMLTSLYKKLEGEEIPTSPSSNKMFAKNVKYNDKVYRNFIKEMNAAIRQQRMNN